MENLKIWVRFNLQPEEKQCAACGRPFRPPHPVWAYQADSAAGVCEPCLDMFAPTAVRFLSWCYNTNSKAAGKMMQYFRNFQTIFQIWTKDGLIRVDSSDGSVMLYGRDAEELGRLFSLTSLWLKESGPNKPKPPSKSQNILH